MDTYIHTYIHSYIYINVYIHTYIITVRISKLINIKKKMLKKYDTRLVDYGNVEITTYLLFCT